MKRHYYAPTSEKDAFTVLVTTEGGDNLIHYHQACITIARLNGKGLLGTHTLDRQIFDGFNCGACGKPLLEEPLT